MEICAGQTAVIPALIPDPSIRGSHFSCMGLADVGIVPSLQSPPAHITEAPQSLSQRAKTKGHTLLENIVVDLPFEEQYRVTDYSGHNLTPIPPTNV